MRDLTLDRLEPIDAARRIAEERIPFADGVIVAGSVLSSLRTTNSDLNIVIAVSQDQQSFRETVRSHDCLAELFVSTASSFDSFVRQEIAARRSPLLQISPGGVILFSRNG
ncbi:MAG TPA: hypothetical protein VNF05_07930 [Acidimicrobiales bacterium]|nr:hypothetical protein [Acidimicrobiales bacterium]